MELPVSEGFSTILVVVNRLSKMAHFLTLVGASAMDNAHAFIKEIIRLHDLPKSIVSDRGVQFTSRFWRAFCKALDIEVCLSSAYHPQSNGQREQIKRWNNISIVFLHSRKITEYLCFLVPSLHTIILYTLLPMSFWANYGFHPSFLPHTVPKYCTCSTEQVNFHTGKLRDSSGNHG